MKLSRLTFMLVVALILTVLFSTTAFADQNTAPYRFASVDSTDPNYWTEELEAQAYNYRMVRNYPTLYTSEAWEAAQNAGSLMLNIDPNAINETEQQRILDAKAAFGSLKDSQVKSYNDGINGEVIFIWGENNMPITTPVEELVFTPEHYDNADFVPYMIPYLLEDPASAKGTIIVLSGGGNSTRSNPNEGYRVCPGFNELGYNCFLLQRRVEPYNNDDICMDLQRTVRLVKYRAAEWGIDLEHTLLAVSGYSGGGGNIGTMLTKFYGEITPDQFDASYVCDEIDAVNSDVDIAHIIYSAGIINTENPHLPHMFIAVGADDNGMGGYGFERAYDMFKQAYELGLNPELQVYAKNGHGFGAGNAGTTSMLWMNSCDLYMQKVMGYAEVSYEGEVPEEYTLTQDIVVDWFPISDATPVNAYTNAERSKVLFTFFGWGENIMVEGLLINNRVADVTYDSVGYFSADCPLMWELIDPTAWRPVE